MTVNVKVIGAGLFLLIGGLFLAACGRFQVGVITAEANQPEVVATEIPKVEEIAATPDIVEKAAPGNDGVAVKGWLGRVVGLPSDSQFDDYLELAPQGSGEFGLTGASAMVEAEIAALQDIEEPGGLANFWGELFCGVPDHGGCQLVVSKIRAGSVATDPEPVDGWQGTLRSTSSNAQFDDAFVLAGDYPVQFGISSAIAENGWPVYVEELENLRDSGDLIEIWGVMICGVPDVNGCQIQVTQLHVGGQEVDPYTGWKSYENDAYGFQLRYPDTWKLTEMPPEDMSAQGGPILGSSIQLTSGDMLLYIGFRRPAEEVILGGTGMPAGELEVMGKVRILGMDVEKSAIVYEGKVKTVSYSPVLVDGKEFVMRADDVGTKDYAALDLTMEMQVEIEQILSTLEVVDAGE